ncbi:MAG: hypothetical protein KDA45_08785, partial [Planctomycetales bacterium]|nr:hypothetical protein [Planctomycetales bacterium]
MRQPTAIFTILLVLGVLTSGSGCQVLGIPSCRYAAPGGLDEAGICTEECSSQAYDAEVTACPTGFLPPLPAWLSCWRTKQEASPPPYPRF